MNAPRAPNPTSPAATPRAQGGRFARWFFPLLAVLGLGAGLFTSLWIGGQSVERAVVVQMPTKVVPGRPMPIRATLYDADDRPLERPCPAAVWIDGAGDRVPLGALRRLGRGFDHTCGVVWMSPEAALGPAEVQLEFPAAAADGGSKAWNIPVTVVDGVKRREGALLTNFSKLALGDDSDEQPASLKIDLRAMGRMVSEFHNTFMVRVTDPEGAPHVGPLEVRLVSGRLDARRGAPEDGPVVHAGVTDRFGLARFEGVVNSDVLRFEVRVPADSSEAPSESTAADAKKAAAPSQEATPRASRAQLSPGGVQRTVRVATFPGASRLYVEPRNVRRGQPVDVQVARLSGRHGYMVDVHDAEGAWIDFIPFEAGQKGRRRWTAPTDAGAGLFHLEAYRAFTPGQAGLATRGLMVTEDDATFADMVDELATQRRVTLDSEHGWEADEVKRRRGWLTAVTSTLRRSPPASADVAEDDGASVVAWLMGTAPLQNIGIPTALRSRPDDEAALRTRRTALNGTVRLGLLVGGGVYLLLFGAWTVWEARRQRMWVSSGDDDDPSLMGPSVAQVAARLLLLAMVVGGVLALTISLFDNLIWSYK